jgi:hypothetical protein
MQRQRRNSFEVSPKKRSETRLGPRDPRAREREKRDADVKFSSAFFLDL